MVDRKKTVESALVAVYDIQASAGDGAYPVDEYRVGSLAFPKNYLRSLTRANPHDLAIISVKGDSMLPTLADDDVVMLDTSKRDLSYDGLFVIRDNGDALLVKRIGRASQPGCVTIISDNRQLYASVEKALTDIDVVGRVIWTGGKV
ncbi:putative HTH-type transcriptional regulator [Yoonia vestfoldensis]|uniref:Putative HTH-type transcriptional regulator n=2 Tax=Yoonia vestfoldensis TaxID=245188 RepID=A0A1Y0EH81_9RHOB|nr:putative HTH-type transcriptional regulator [Yoonia vestfoldensis]